MNARRRIFAIAQRELLDFVRDWRTILTMVLVPLLLFPRPACQLLTTICRALR